VSSATVVGAGVFGASTARELARRGWDVTLVEQYAPGTVRSASGGDTRLLRTAHGSVDWYADLAWQARTAWLELQKETGTRIWEPVGIAWFARQADGFEAASRESLRRTLETGRTWFWSRSRQEFWCKGETSGDRQYVRAGYYDCDIDVLLFVVVQEGRGACHTGEHSCFFRAFGGGAAPEHL